MRKSFVKKLVMLSLFIAMATILTFIEGRIAPLASLFMGQPVKLGLANIFTLTTLTLYGVKSGFVVGVMRVILASFLSGKFLTPVFYLSFGGAVLSTLCMALAITFLNKHLSNVGISLIGAVTHNIAQIIVVIYLLETPLAAISQPLLIALAIPTGIFVGVSTNFVTKALNGAKIAGI
ncbi:Gx transporter family protein [Proteinivorax hydrogeniformans]|uniref:Gx transporter family protein n=1 Tax=Proteinivorax hydrogeniformans TaxID=1826727 RepID=A0AAU8HWI0_9FIRM